MGAAFSVDFASAARVDAGRAETAGMLPTRRQDGGQASQLESPVSWVMKGGHPSALREGVNLGLVGLVAFPGATARSTRRCAIA